ncbi:helix-turn-helix domain-containing protein [Microbacterium sp. MYb64]|uniref:ArsR/SmtB family transcription factor n=1 Tax=Microbacterium sp. MYb64 TaxID=1848691 RepID=UPI002158896B|nr:helix-turn-helix domain-containing protein [Microbacterium sp. MYb64]
MDRNMEGVEWEHHRVDFRLSPGDIQAVRFGISPGHELAHAIRVLLRPEQYPLAWGWLKEFRGRVPREAFGVLAQVIGADGYMPDFLTTTARWDLTPDDELAAIRSAPLGGMRVDLGKMVVRSSGRRQEALRGMQDDPARARAVIADAWAEVWESAMAPVWPQLERILRADVAVRSRSVATEGLAAMASGIHPWVSWGDGSVRVRLRRHSEDVDCRGSGLVLVPSVMSSWGCMVITEPPAQPTLYYPARGVTAGWARDADDLVHALEALVGPVRAGILLAAHVPRTTTRVAEEAGIAASTASHHLRVLRDAGLLVSTRDGARMMHLRSPLGEALVGAAL